ncbi:hypothetical protein MMEU_0901 [Mycobacterium marinum str. Europe]|nr:hypothetical protein MMEU_0901 [Mycobacterium marinum str. Europe]
MVAADSQRDYPTPRRPVTAMTAMTAMTASRSTVPLATY